MRLHDRRQLPRRQHGLGFGPGVVGAQLLLPRSAPLHARFTAYSKGDLNCNSTLSQFFRSGGISSIGDVTGAYQPTIVNELE
jgi:hypothetical protein